MKPAETRSYRLNYLLRFYLNCLDEDRLFYRAKLMGISEKTAREYVQKVITQVIKQPRQVLST